MALQKYDVIFYTPSSKSPKGLVNCYYYYYYDTIVITNNIMFELLKQQLVIYDKREVLLAKVFTSKFVVLVEWFFSVNSGCEFVLL